MITLISKSSTGKLRFVKTDYQYDESQKGFVITRYTGQVGGKETKQPDKLITQGKVKRSVEEQCELEFNHLVKEYKDKGYKELPEPLESYTIDMLLDIVGSNVTGVNGIVKPMKAKQADQIKNKKVFDLEYYASRKIDGNRVLIYQNDKGTLQTASRGAMDYNSAMVTILTHPTLIKIFNEHPGLILDGELYKHGMSLQKIGSIARSQTVAKDLFTLEFYWYDVVLLDKSFEDRLNFINDIANKYNLSFDPNRTFGYDDLRIQVVPHVPISGWDNMIKLHNEYVNEGWEGVVIRNKTSLYKPNARCNDWIKIKVYKDDCFKVIGYELGLRGIEDMVFIMQLTDGRTFKAKPYGDKEIKEDYVNNFDSVYKDHIAECKFFCYSDNGIPTQPSLRSFRFDLE